MAANKRNSMRFDEEWLRNRKRESINIDSEWARNRKRDSINFDGERARKRESITFDNFVLGGNNHNNSDSGLTFALQALLARHETYMAESEKTRESMSIKIQELEQEKKDLEAENVKTAQENLELQERWSTMNNTITDSELRVKSLEATLEAAQQELRRLDGIAERTEDLEGQLATLEEEQLALLHTATVSEADGRLSAQRWKKAEKNLNDVHDQLERIDREAREERERHAEIIARLTRQQDVEKVLKSDVSKATATGKANNNVVSHFVKDILEDNANLQSGMTELREMLMSSQDELQVLREQIMHSPMRKRRDDDDDDGPPTLRAELAPKQTPTVSQELHIHHHYHAPVKTEVPRLKKKRRPINASLFSPPPQTSAGGRLRSAPTRTTSQVVSETGTSIPTSATPNHRWSMASETTISDFSPSSAPTSPQSYYRTSSLFDRGLPDGYLDSSRPTSPTSSIGEPTSPISASWNRKRDSSRSFAPSIAFNLSNTIHEERGEDSDAEDALPNGPVSPADEECERAKDDTAVHAESTEQREREYFNPMAYPSLRRATSHESILSISGLDIHTLSTRQTAHFQITGSNRLLNTRMRPTVGDLATSYVSAQPVTSSAIAVARPTLNRRGQDSSTYLRSSMGLPERAPPARASNSAAESAASTAGVASRVGGWFGTRWGAQPAQQAQPLPAKPSARAVSSNLRPGINANPKPAARAVSHGNTSASTSDGGKPIDPDPLKTFMGGRPPGINQKGRVPGVWAKERTPSKIVPDRVDVGALAEGLME